jgi:hypothetical protein
MNHEVPQSVILSCILLIFYILGKNISLNTLWSITVCPRSPLNIDLRDKGSFGSSFKYVNVKKSAMPCLRRLYSGLSLLRPGFDRGSIHVGFVVDKVALGQVYARVLRFSPVNFISPVPITWKNRKKINHLHHRVAE